MLYILYIYLHIIIKLEEIQIEMSKISTEIEELEN